MNVLAGVTDIHKEPSPTFLSFFFFLLFSFLAQQLVCLVSSDLVLPCLLCLVLSCLVLSSYRNVSSFLPPLVLTRDLLSSFAVRAVVRSPYAVHSSAVCPVIRYLSVHRIRRLLARWLSSQPLSVRSSCVLSTRLLSVSAPRTSSARSVPSTRPPPPRHAANLPTHRLLAVRYPYAQLPVCSLATPSYLPTPPSRVRAVRSPRAVPSPYAVRSPSFTFAT
jgi:hypothetical protein